MSEDTHTRKPGKVSLYPLKFEDALKGLLKTKPPKKQVQEDRKQQDASPPEHR
jgi:hypothetical protein